MTDNIVHLARYRASPLDRATAALLALKEHDALAAEVRERMARTAAAFRDAQNAHRASMRTLGPCSWTSALYRRREARRADQGRAAADWHPVWRRSLDLKSAAGAALAPLGKPEARRLYTAVWGEGLSRQKVEWEVSSLLSRHRMEIRARGIA